MSPIREYRWTFRSELDLTPETRQIAQSLSQELSVSPILTEILVSRGIDTFEKARAFFPPQLGRPPRSVQYEEHGEGCHTHLRGPCEE